MIVFVIIFPIENNTKIVDFFTPYFIKKYKHRCKIIYKYKLLPLHTRLLIKKHTKSHIKIKLISYYDTVNIDDIITESISFSEIYASIIYKKNIQKYMRLKSNFYNWSVMEYTTLKTWNEMNIIDDDFLSIFNSREIPKLKKIKIFGKKFVENNQDKCIIIYKGRIFPLQEYFTLKDSENENHIQIILIEYGIITDKSYLFHNCEHLTKFPYIEYDIVKQVDPTVKEYNELYNKYKLNLKEEDNILENAQKELIIENIYKEYNPSNYYNNKPNFNFNDSINNSQINQANPLISNLPSMKKNYLNNAYYINSIYKLCTTLIHLPDIAEWKTDKLENISHMFSGCTLLESIPDIAMWDTKSLIYMDHLFEECILLKSIPNIVK